jgi:hypothetical protein
MGVVRSIVLLLLFLWTYSCFAAEDELAVESGSIDALLKTLDPFYKQHVSAEAPTFRWPPEVIEAYNRIEAEKGKM